MNAAYYNEHDDFAASWLEELIKGGHIMDGVVDRRSIEDVLPSELMGFTRCHFFAGIGGWDYALQLAGWPDDRQIWTGSCPCQPFSAAGQGGGFADERDLWPAWHWLIQQCRPPVIMGEQVETAIRHGWLDLVHNDLEGEGYAVGAVGLPAACVGAPHIRQRVWFVAESESTGGRGRQSLGNRRPEEFGRSGASNTGELGHPDHTGPQGHGRPLAVDDAAGRQGTERHDPTTGFWRDLVWLPCRDGKSRPAPVESLLQPLASRVPNRVGLLRGAGNSISPQVGAEVIKAYMRVRGL